MNDASIYAQCATESLEAAAACCRVGEPQTDHLLEAIANALVSIACSLGAVTE